MDTRISRRALLKSGGVLVVSLGLGRLGEKLVRAQAAPPDVALGKTVAADAVDGFLAIHPDGAVTLFSGKVDLGTGVRAALRQMVAEELDVPVARIRMVEGDTALTPDQGSTAGSYTIARGGATIRQAAATARGALLRLAAERFGRPATDLEVVDGVVRVKGGGPALSYGELIGGQRFDLAIDPKAPRKKPADYKIVGRPVPRPDLPAKVTGQHLYVHDFVFNVDNAPNACAIIRKVWGLDDRP